MTIVLALLFGALIGVLLGMVGGGGSILTVPILVYVLDQDVHHATATSLVIVGVTALFGMVPHAQAKRVDFRTAMLFGSAGIAGAFAGTWLSSMVSGTLLLLLFGVLMLVVAARMMAGRPAAKGNPGAGLNREAIWLAPVAGLVVGVTTGFFGVGGGFLIVPALVMVMGFPMRLAVGTSLLIIAVNSTAGIVAQLGSGNINLGLALVFAVGGIAGAMTGGRLAGRVNDARLSQAFAALVGVVGSALVLLNGLKLA